MALSSFWIDPDELARLGAELVTSDADEVGHLSEEGPIINLFGDPVGIENKAPEESPAMHQELGRAAEQLASIKARAVKSGLLRFGPDGAASATLAVMLYSAAAASPVPVLHHRLYARLRTHAAAIRHGIGHDRV